MNTYTSSNIYTSNILLSREKHVYESLLKNFIPKGCKLDHLGILVEENRIVNPGVTFQFQRNDKRHVTVFLNNERAGNIFYKEENGYIKFYTYNNDNKLEKGLW